MSSHLRFGLIAAAVLLGLVASSPAPFAQPGGGGRPSPSNEAMKRLTSRDRMASDFEELEQRITLFFRDATSNAPLAGVEIAVGSETFETDAKGRVAIPIPGKDAELCLTAKKAGYTTLRASMLLEGGTVWNPVYLLSPGEGGQAEKCYLDIQPKLQRKGESIDINVNFETNKADLTNLGKQQVEEIARAMLRILSAGEGAPRFALIGHTDSRGSAKDNLDLSRRRAESVRAYIAERYSQIPAASIGAEGKGEGELLAKGDSEEAHAKNRRVVVKRLD